MRLIDGDALHEEIREYYCKQVDLESPMQYGAAEAMFLVRLTPTINPEDLRPKGAWLYKDNEKYYWYECSVCGEHTPTKWCMNEWVSPFCPNCGAKMESAER